MQIAVQESRKLCILNSDEGRIRLRNMLERSGMRRCISGSESRVSIRGSVASSVLFKKDYVMLHSCNINYILNSESADIKLVLAGAMESTQCV